MSLGESFRITVGKSVIGLVAILVVIFLGVDLFNYSGFLSVVVLLLNIYIGTSIISYFNSKLTKEGKVYLLLGLFVGSLAAANLLGSKIMTVWSVSASVGIFAYPLTFLITDSVAEVYGKSKTRNFVWTGLASQLLILFLVWMSINLPPASRYTLNSEYVAVFSLSIRMIIASITAFIISQLHDIWAFHFWKKKTKGKYLWLRNNLSTFFSQIIDTLVFMYLAFYMMTPMFTAGFVLSLSIPYFILKMVIALIDTPFVYMLVRWIRKGE